MNFVHFLLVLWVLLVAFLGLWHAFPLRHIFYDEISFASGVLQAFETRSFLPRGAVPYGTLTFYLLMPVHAIQLAILWVLNGFSVDQVKELVMHNLWIAFIPPRVFNAVLYCCVCLIVWQFLKQIWFNQRSQAEKIALFLLLTGNTTLVLYSHSGKMWITSIFFVLLAGIFIPKRPTLAVTMSALAFANFPIMGFFWVLTVAVLFLGGQVCWRQVLQWGAITTLSLAVVFLINYEGILFNFSDIFAGQIPGALDKSSQNQSALFFDFLNKYGHTFVSTIIKVFKIYLPFLIVISVILLSKPKIHIPLRFWWSVFGIIGYILTISLMVFSAEPDRNFRYLLPLPLLFIPLITSLEWKQSSHLKAVVLGGGAVSAYTTIILLITLMRTTTYEQTIDHVRNIYNTKQTLIVSTVLEVNAELNRQSAEMLKKYYPVLCHPLCERFLSEEDTYPGAFAGAWITKPPHFADPLTDWPPAGYHLVFISEASTPYIDVERGLGSYLHPSAWWPHQLGKQIIVKDS